jgi:hypothetical protein
MRPLRLARKPQGEAVVDLCADCQALWFDSHESLQLTPGATLALFEAIRVAKPGVRRPLPARLPCPRCTVPLALTRDVQRTTRFTYYRCEGGHGRFTPFVSFLREKDFIRPLAPAELERLKSSIRVIGCSTCGAPVDLGKDPACPYCRAPISILDPDAVAATVGALRAAEAQRATIDVVALADAMLAVPRREPDAGPWTRAPESGAGAAVDLVRLGLEALAGMLAR